MASWLDEEGASLGREGQRKLFQARNGGEFGSPSHLTSRERPDVLVTGTGCSFKRDLGYARVVSPAETGKAMLNPENETRTVVFTFADIIIARFRKGAEVTLDDARANVALCLQRNEGRRRPLLVDLREVKSQTAEARAYLAGREGVQVSQAVGLLIGSPVSRVLGNFYLGLNKPSVPTRLFTSEEEAQAWLRSFLTP